MKDPTWIDLFPDNYSPSERIKNLELAVQILAKNQERIGQELIEAVTSLNTLLEQIKKAVEDLA